MEETVDELDAVLELSPDKALLAWKAVPEAEGLEEPLLVDS
tara:strand:- start:233 stop:355 length:123 start_codon:yes stop_codon:yes gene_type:complete